MVPIYAPPITRLVDLGAALLQGAPAQAPFLEALAEARAFHDGSRDRFRFWSTSAAVSLPDVQELVHGIEEGFAERLRVFDGLQAAVEGGDTEALRRLLDALQAVSHQLQERAHRLEERGQALPRLSPIPHVDDFIRVGVNVYNGVYGARALHNRLPVLLSVVEGMEEQKSLFAAAHEDEADLAGELEADLGDLKTAVGAIYTYMEQGDPRDLLFGLKLLGIASTNAWDDLARMDRVRLAEGASANPYLARLATALRLGDRAEWQEAVEGARAWLRREEAELLRMFDDFLVPLSLEESLRPELEESLRQAWEALEGAAGWPVPANAGDAVAALVALAADLDRRGQEAFDAILARPDLGGDLEVESLVQVLKGAADGVVPANFLQERIAVLESRNEGLRKRIATLPPDPVFSAGRAALTGQRQALEAASRFLADGNREHLALAYDLLTRHQPALTGLESLLSERESQHAQVVCPRCGASSPQGGGRCGVCRSPLPVFNDFPEASLDLLASEGGILTRGADSEVLPTGYPELEQAVLGWLAGAVDRAEVEAGLDLFRSRLAFNRQQVGARLAPAAAEDADLAARVARLEEALAHMEAGVEAVAAAGDEEAARAGLATMRWAGAALFALHQEGAGS